MVRCFDPPALGKEDAVWLDEVVLAEPFESYEVLRERLGWDVGELMDEGRSESDRSSDARSMCLSLKLKRLLVADGEGLSIADGMFFKKSRYADGGVIGVLRSSLRRRPGEGAMGLRVSEGNVPEPGV